jgi:hypothetical protein
MRNILIAVVVLTFSMAAFGQAGTTTKKSTGAKTATKREQPPAIAPRAVQLTLPDQGQPPLPACSTGTSRQVRDLWLSQE